MQIYTHDRPTGETKELKGVRKTSEELAAECDAFVENGGEVKQIDNLGRPAAMNKTLEIEKLARNWMCDRLSKVAAKAGARKLGVSFKVIIDERNRRIKRDNAARGRKS